MDKLIYVGIFFIFWLICNVIVRKTLYDNMSDKLVVVATKYRKTIMFDIIVIFIFIIFNFNFLLWLGIAYYIIIAILEGILLIISIFTNLDYYIKEKIFETNMWLLVLTKLLNEIATIMMIFALFSLLN